MIKVTLKTRTQTGEPKKRAVTFSLKKRTTVGISKRRSMTFTLLSGAEC